MRIRKKSELTETAAANGDNNEQHLLKGQAANQVRRINDSSISRPHSQTTTEFNARVSPSVNSNYRYGNYSKLFNILL